MLKRHPNLVASLPILAITTTILLMVPALSWACPTCYSASSQRVISTYLWSAALLTLLPFSMLGIGYAIVVYLRRQSEQLTRQETGSLDPLESLTPLH